MDGEALDTQVRYGIRADRKYILSLQLELHIMSRPWENRRITQRIDIVFGYELVKGIIITYSYAPHRHLHLQVAAETTNLISASALTPHKRMCKCLSWGNPSRRV
jgi:hypothetical protein